MKSIIYIVPYFGKLPDFMSIWLHTCKMNPTVNWLIFTDDKQELNYPENVKVVYMSFQNLRNHIQGFYDFTISLDRPYKLCDYKVAYGEIFHEYIKEYDFWGHCDLDLMWGDIRHFLTDEILEAYDKIGQFGHSTLYKNNEQVNARYRSKLNGTYPFKEIFQCEQNCMFDEGDIDRIYSDLGIDVYHDIIFVNLSALHYNFFIRHLPIDDAKRDQIFVWNFGKLFCKYVQDGNIHDEEYMYIHFLQRPMDISVLDERNLPDNITIIPNKLIEKKSEEIDIRFIKHSNRPRQIKYYMLLLKRKRGCITPLRVIRSLKVRIKGIIHEKKQNI